MKIAILWWWYDMLPLCQVLMQYDHEYIFYVDQKHAPFCTKSFDLTLDRITTWIKYCLNELWAEYCIVPPIVELEILHGTHTLPFKNNIIPLFTRFLREALTFSRIWKIWLVTTRNENERLQQLFRVMTVDHLLTENQKSTPNFNFPFAVWIQSVPMWAYFLQGFSKKDWMVRKMIKKDTMYFRDADVDLILPASWTCLYYEKIITHLFTNKRIFWKGVWLVTNVFEAILKEYTTNTKSLDAWDLHWKKYSIVIYTTDSAVWFLKQKKRESLLTRWGKYSLDITLID